MTRVIVRYAYETLRSVMDEEEEKPSVQWQFMKNKSSNQHRQFTKSNETAARQPTSSRYRVIKVIQGCKWATNIKLLMVCPCRTALY